VLDSQQLDAQGRGYPRPQLRRQFWVSLNGRWDFAVDRDALWQSPTDVRWDATIEVPFAPETPASGIGHTSFLRACWYRRTVSLPETDDGQRVILHFGAVDYDSTVWVDGQCIGNHEGGYTPFCFDVSPWAGRSVPVVVRAEDDPHDLAKPRGKQDWQPVPHSIWYPRTTGIWQTVWIEVVPRTSLESVRWTPTIERWEIGLESWLAGARRDGLRLHVKLTIGDQLIADDTYSVVSGEVHR
jgi:beta-galactosidase/beta-glucuronidase